MGDILDEASALVQCKQCPWYKSCVAPMRFNAEDIAGQMQQAMPQDSAGMPKFFSELAAASQNLLLESCPIFINRLKSSPKLAEQIKKIMLSWGSDETQI